MSLASMVLSSFALCAFAVSAQAQVKKCVLPNGKTVYQDAPCETGTQRPVALTPTHMGNEPVVGLPMAAAANSQWGKAPKTYSIESARGLLEVWEYPDGRRLTFANGRIAEVIRGSGPGAASQAASQPSR